jgi:RIO-like serine/threonine protein kinase
MLDELDLFVLQVICKATHISKSAHVPPEAFVKRLPFSGRRIKKALKKLVTSGYVQLHPTRGGMTYALTKAGLDKCREIFWKK